MASAVSFDELQLWIDPVARIGPEAMAVDEWLLNTAVQPILRVYQWAGNWGSLGYFSALAPAVAAFPDLSWVRRWTGGGIVDHRDDWTYSVIIPATHPMARLKGAESYRVLHNALAGALSEEGTPARLATEMLRSDDALCFQNPVDHDVIGPGNLKLAGAGQRRTKLGLLHQGSVSGGFVSSDMRASRLAARLSATWQPRDFHPPQEIIHALICERYAHSAWTMRR